MKEIFFKQEVELKLFDNNSNYNTYILSYKGRHWKVTSFVAIVFKLIQETKCIDKTYKIISDNNSDVSYENVYNVYEFFEKNGLLIGTKDTYIKKNTNKNLWGKITVIPAKIVNKSKFLCFMFDCKVMITIGFIEIIFIMYLFVTYSSQEIISSFSSLNIQQLVISGAIIILLGLFHEFGHSIALIRYGELSGAIGMGIYMYMPVFYSDVTNAWKLKRMQRVIVDIGGIYFQSFAIFMLYMITEMANISYMKIAIILSALQIIGNFNPFIKLDGYWMICDWFGITSPYKIIVDKIKGILYQKNRNEEFDGLKNQYKIAFIFYAVIMILYFGYLINLIFNLILKAIFQLREDIKLIQFKLLDYISFTEVITFLKSRIMLYLVLIFTIRGIYLIIKKILWRYHENNKKF